MPEAAPIRVRREVIWERDNAVAVEVLGVSTHTLIRWSREEGLTKYTRGKGKGSRDYWILDEVLAFLRASGRTNHEQKGAAK